MTYRYSVDACWSDEDQAFVAVCPELGGLSALGATRQEAVVALEEVVEMALEAVAAEGKPLPVPRVRPAYSGQFRVRLPRSLHAWLAEEAAREGVSLNTFVVTRLSEARGNRAPRTSVRLG
ncbi:MAG TPA: toxin-antitoxin system HicB family antitoxin [Longimicrobiales bacterium]|nr:toxin-antitoxin system HicB family antitoxin [Longimicrobiales bacterium]